MIRYTLKCSNDHEFDAWFRNSIAFDDQRTDGQLACPQCADRTVTKSLMAPSISSTKTDCSATTLKNRQAIAQSFRAKLRDIARKVQKDGENVGSEFPEHARKIHFNETPPRQIWGQATPSEVKDLLDDGITVIPLPDLPEDNN